MGKMMELRYSIIGAYSDIGDMRLRLRRAHRRTRGASPARLNLCKLVDGVDIILDAMSRAAVDFSREQVETIPIHGDFAP